MGGPPPPPPPPLGGPLADTAEAINAWRAVLDTFGPERSTLAALAALYEKAERYADLADATRARSGELIRRVPRGAGHHLAVAEQAAADVRWQLLFREFVASCTVEIAV